MLPLVLAGGRAIRYSSMLTLDIRKRSIQEADPVSRDEGMKIGVTINKNHCRQDRMPYLKTEYFVVYGQGTERSIEIIELAEKCGILTKKGSWYREYSGEYDTKGNPLERILENGTKAAWNGMKNTRAYILSHPEYFDYLVNKVENFGQIDVETLSEEEIKKLEEEHKLEETSASEQDITLDDIIQDPDTTKTEKSTKKKK